MATVHTPWVQNPKPGVGGGGFTLRRRELSENLQRHHQAVGAAVPTVATWNAEHVTLTTQSRHNRGVNRVREARQAEIKRLNGLLVDRITDTALKTSSSFVQPETYPASGHRRPHTHRSLNYVARKRERDRIARDNLALAKRILDKKPVLQHEHWNKHSQVHDRLLGNIAKFTEVPIGDSDMGMMAHDVEATEGLPSAINSNNNNNNNNGDMMDANDRSITPRGGMLRPLSDSQRRSAFEKLNAEREASSIALQNSTNNMSSSAPHTARRHHTVAPLTQRRPHQQRVEQQQLRDEKEVESSQVGYHDVANDEKESTFVGGRRGRRVVIANGSKGKPAANSGVVRWDYQTVAAMYPEALPGHTYFRLARTEAFLSIDAAGTGVDLSPVIDNNAAWLTVPIHPVSPSPTTSTATSSSSSSKIDPACYAWRLQLLDGSHSLYHISTSTQPNLYLTSSATNGALTIIDTPTNESVWRLDPDGRGLIRNERTQQYLAASSSGELYVSPHPDVWGQYCAQWRMAGPMGSQCLHSARLPICVLPQRERRVISAAPFDATALPATVLSSSLSSTNIAIPIAAGTVGVQHAATGSWLTRTPEGGVTLSATTAADPTTAHWMMARDAHGGQWLRACGTADTAACLLATMDRPSPPAGARIPQPNTPSTATTLPLLATVTRRLAVVAPRVGDQPWLVIAPAATANTSTATPSPPPAIAGQL